MSRLPSGRYRARYTAPDGERHSAPHTFDTIGDADTWLTLRRAEVLKHEWAAPAPPVVGRLFGEYSQEWLARQTRVKPLKPRTAEHYERLLATHLRPLDDVPLKKISPELVEQWHGAMVTGPTMRAHAYSLLRTVLNAALRSNLIAVNPCQIPKAGKAKRVHTIEPLGVGEIPGLVAAMPERYRAMTLLAIWCGLRFGELIALRRCDIIDPAGGVVEVSRGVVRVHREMVVGKPKSEAGKRRVAVPPHIAPVLVDHLETHTKAGRDALLFPADDGSFLSSSTLYRYFHPAREAIGRPDLRWHDLRHTGAVLAAQTGATLAELMGRLGHSTPAMAMRYQHVALGRDAAIAARLSDLAGGHKL